MDVLLCNLSFIFQVAIVYFVMQRPSGYSLVAEWATLQT